MLVTVKNGTVFVTDPSGRVLRSIRLQGIKSADYNPKMDKGVAVKTDGNVILFDKDGKSVRTIAKSARNAVFSGDDLVVTLDSGRVELRRLDGSLIRKL